MPLSTPCPRVQVQPAVRPPRLAHRESQRGGGAYTPPACPSHIPSTLPLPLLLTLTHAHSPVFLPSDHLCMNRLGAVCHRLLHGCPHAQQARLHAPRRAPGARQLRGAAEPRCPAIPRVDGRRAEPRGSTSGGSGDTVSGTRGEAGAGRTLGRWQQLRMHGTDRQGAMGA